jgi:hypothetical protein
MCTFCIDLDASLDLLFFYVSSFILMAQKANTQNHRIISAPVWGKFVFKVNRPNVYFFTTFGRFS